MNWFNMLFQTSLHCSFIFTLITRILDFQMDWINMTLQTTLSSSFISTLITRILDFLMDWFNMTLQTTLCRSFIITLITIVLDFLMDWFNMTLQMWGSPWEKAIWVFRLNPFIESSSQAVQVCNFYNDKEHI